MSTRVKLGGKTYYLGDEELFVSVVETAYDTEYEIVTYQINTVWVDDNGAWQESRQLNVSLDYQPELYDCLKRFVGEYQSAQLMYNTDPDHAQMTVAVATLIGSGETRFVLYA